MEAKTKITLKEAERLLALQEYDSAHDLAHHQSVYKTASEIGKQIDEDYDTHVLHIACMWHDVVSKKYDAMNHKEVTADTAQYLKTL